MLMQENSTRINAEKNKYKIKLEFRWFYWKMTKWNAKVDDILEKKKLTTEFCCEIDYVVYVVYSMCRHFYCVDFSINFAIFTTVNSEAIVTFMFYCLKFYDSKNGSFVFCCILFCDKWIKWMNNDGNEKFYLIFELKWFYIKLIPFHTSLSIHLEWKLCLYGLQRFVIFSTFFSNRNQYCKI